MACVAPSYGDPFVSGLLGYIDCQTQSIAAGGFQSLASPASFAAPFFAALLTLFVAVIGYRLLTGWTPTMGDTIGATLKVGVALTLATSWIAYRTVIYDPVLRGPAEIGAAIGGPTGPASGQQGLIGRLQSVDDAIVRLTDLGVGRLDRAPLPKPGETTVPTVARAPLADDLAFSVARVAFLSGAVGTLGFARLVSGVLLALAPLFAGLLLFEATRGLFFGWLRTMVATSLAALTISIVLWVEIGLLEPWLASAIAQREAVYATPAAPIELLSMTAGFAIILLACAGFSARLALFAPPAAWPDRLREFWVRDRGPLPIPSSNGPQRETAPIQSLTRAETIAAAVTDSQRREASRTPDRVLLGDRTQGASTAASTSTGLGGNVPLGQSYRSVGSRVTAPRSIAR